MSVAQFSGLPLAELTQRLSHVDGKPPVYALVPTWRTFTRRVRDIATAQQAVVVPPAPALMPLIPPVPLPAPPQAAPAIIAPLPA
jgi:hypothetical protein